LAETIGSLADKLSIIELKIYHMQEQAEHRDDASDEFRAQCRERVTILRIQRDQLAAELTDLLSAIAAGRVVPNVYRQFKMYNDVSYRPVD
jgi:hypothetical protein